MIGRCVCARVLGGCFFAFSNGGMAWRGHVAALMSFFAGVFFQPFGVEMLKPPPKLKAAAAAAAAAL